MSSRYGRNKRRRHREEISRLRAIAYGPYPVHEPREGDVRFEELPGVDVSRTINESAQGYEDRMEVTFLLTDAARSEAIQRVAQAEALLVRDGMAYMATGHSMPLSQTVDVSFRRVRA